MLRRVAAARDRGRRGGTEEGASCPAGERAIGGADDEAANGALGEALFGDPAANAGSGRWRALLLVCLGIVVVGAAGDGGREGMRGDGGGGGRVGGAGGLSVGVCVGVFGAGL